MNGSQNVSLFAALLTVCLFLSPLTVYTVFGQERTASSGERSTAGTTEEKKTPGTNARKISARAAVLTANIINVSKGAQGVGSPITERKPWTTIAATAPFQGVVAEAEKLQKTSIPQSAEADYLRYYLDAGKTADANDDYKKKFDERRNRFYTLVLAECFENKGRFFADIEKVIQAICAEKCWTYPQNDSGAKMYQGESKEINEDVARTAWDLATAYYWLGRKISEQTRTLIQEQVKERVFTVFETAVVKEQYESAAWVDDAGAANAACHAAVVGAALALFDSAERRAQYIAAAELNVEKFLQNLTRDGYFTDGINDWNDGYGSFIQLAELLYQATNGRIDMFRRPNIRETALYGLRMEIIPGVYEMVGDRQRGGQPILFPTAFISKRFSMGLTAIENHAPFFGIGPGHLYDVGVFCFPNSASEKRGLTAKPAVLPLETLRSEFPLNGIMILRTGKKDPKQIGVQVKGGTNDERGNHNDVGTYVVALGNGVPLCDIGARFNRQGLTVPDPYASNFSNSFGHPVPKVDDKLQKNGEGTLTPLLLKEYKNEADTIRFDLQYVYDWTTPRDVKEFTRTFVYDRTGKNVKKTGTANLTVTDRFQVRKPMKYENCLITFGPYRLLTEPADVPALELVVGEDEQALHITVSNEVTEIDAQTQKYVKRNKEMFFEAGALDEPIPQTSRIPFRLAFGFEEPVDDITMTVKIRPASAAERNLVKDKPGLTMQTYTSTIDTAPVEEKIDVQIAAKEGPGSPGGMWGNQVAVPDNVKKYEAAFNQFLIMSPHLVPILKAKSDDELKALLAQFKRTVAAFKDIPDDLEDDLVLLLRTKLEAM